MQKDNQIAIVTGATGGIGREICITLGQAGYRVIGLDLDESKVKTMMLDIDPKHAGFGCNLSNYSQISDVIKHIGEQFGCIDVIVNNAAIGPTMSATVDTSIQEFEQAMAVNWIGPLQLIREALPWMPSHTASVINIASLAGLISNPKRNAYSASKAAMVSLTRSLACELAQKGIRVNAIAPGYVKTPMVAELENSGKVDLSQVRQRIPMGRLARPDEIAKAVTFLVSTHAKYITGSILPIDGGWACFNQPGVAHPKSLEVPSAEIQVSQTAKTARVVVVTGAAQGIGYAIAERFAQQGDTLILIDKNQDKLHELNEKLGSQHLSCVVDLTDEQQLKQVFADIKERYPVIDVLINNAGIAEQFLPIEQQSIAEIEQLFSTNLNGAFCCIREALPAMQAHSGVIINMGSINSNLAFSPRHSYGASKAALEMLTRCLTAELAQQGFRIVTLCPGYIQTPGVAHLQRAGSIDINKIRQRIPLGDLGRPEDVAEAAFFLASNDASYINGAALYVDGGWTAFGNAGHASSPIDLNHML